METEKAIGQKAILRQKEIGVISTEGNTLSDVGQPLVETDAVRLKELENLATKTEVALVATETEQAIENINDSVNDIIVKNAQQEAEIIAARLKNINQDLRLDSIENINATQELEIDNNYNKNVQQDTRLEILETSAVAQTSDYSIYSAGGLITPTPSVFKPSSIDRDFIVFTSPKNVAQNLVSAAGFNPGELYVYLKQSCSTEHEFYIVSNQLTDTKVNVIVELWKRDNQEDPLGDTLIDSSNISCDFSTNTQVAGSNSLYGDIIAASSPTDPTGYFLKVYAEEDGTGDNTVSVSLSRVVSKITTIDGGETGVVYDNDVIATNDAGGATVADSINIVNSKADANTVELTTKVEKEVFAANPQFKSSINHNNGAVEIIGDFDNNVLKTKMTINSDGATITNESGSPQTPISPEGIVVRQYLDDSLITKADQTNLDAVEALVEGNTTTIEELVNTKVNNIFDNAVPGSQSSILWETQVEDELPKDETSLKMGYRLNTSGSDRVEVFFGTKDDLTKPVVIRNNEGLYTGKIEVPENFVNKEYTDSKVSIERVLTDGSTIRIYDENNFMRIDYLNADGLKGRRFFVGNTMGFLQTTDGFATTSPYVPTSDTNAANKKYVDDTLLIGRKQTSLELKAEMKK